MILNCLDGVVCMIDDILIHGKDKTEHDEYLAENLKQLEEKHVTLKR